MNEHTNDRPGAVEDSDVAALLRLGGTRPEPPVDTQRRVRAAVLDEWRMVVAARRRRRLVLGGAGLAAAAVVVLAVRATWPGPSPAVVVAPTAVGTVRQVAGGGASRLSRSESDETPLERGQTVNAGDEVATGEGRLGIRLASGASLRLDRLTRVRFASPQSIHLAAGAVYVDNGAASAQLTVDTAHGAVRDIGTQFEVRVETDVLRVRVRSGLVELRRGRDVREARAGTEVIAGPSGITSGAFRPFDAAWQWVNLVAPPFEVEGRTLGALLEHVCREQGWTLRWAEPRLRPEASTTILHGSFEGLTLGDQLRAALTASGLAYRVEDGVLVVGRPATP